MSPHCQTNKFKVTPLSNSHSLTVQQFDVVTLFHLDLCTLLFQSNIKQKEERPDPPAVILSSKSMLTMNTKQRRSTSSSTTTPVVLRAVFFLLVMMMMMAGTAQVHGGNDIDIKNSNDRMDYDLQEVALKHVEDHHNRRMAKLEELIQDRRRRLLSSSSSSLHDEHGTLSSHEEEQELTRTRRQIDVFERKLQHLKQTNTRVSTVLDCYTT
mmetsp:Transcript_34008/g.81759  ORF Transcript_34008/g.81759 Transcript_34008/m.81759 type:complete len:211 (-) Transcript_34008:210-842(-)